MVREREREREREWERVDFDAGDTTRTTRSSGVVAGYSNKRDNNDYHKTDHENNNNACAEEEIGVLIVYDEVRLILHLAIPTIAMQLGSIMPSFFSASFIGRNYGSLYLDAYTLASLVCNLFILTLVEGVYRSLGTLLPQSYGAENYSEMEYTTLRGIILCGCILAFTIPLLMMSMTKLLTMLGEDSGASRFASDWFNIYSLSLPFHVLYTIVSTFLSSQHILTPETIVILFSSLIIFPLLLSVLGNFLGFVGTSVAIAIAECFQLVLLLAYLYRYRPYNLKTWSGLHIYSWKEAINEERFRSFVLLSAGGMMASAYWIYWEVVCLMVGTMGIVELSVQTIPTQLLTVLFMIPYGIGIALSIRIGHLLPRTVSRAKRLCLYAWCISCVLFAFLAYIIYIFRKLIYSIFTTEAEIIEGCEQIWSKVTFYAFNMCIFAVNMGIATGLGKQWLLGAISIFVMWFIGIPSTYYFAIAKNGGLNVAWQTICPAYAAINITLCISFLMTDWDKISTEIRKREDLLRENSELKALSSSATKNNQLDVYEYGSIS